MSVISLFNRCYWQKIGPIQSGLLTNFVIGRHEQRCEIRKHWNPKFKWLRQKKVLEVKIPNFHEKDEDKKKAEQKRVMRERGIKPPRPWVERPFTISCTSDAFEAYVPPEGDGKRSVFSKVGAKQNIEFLEKKSKSMLAIRKIRSYDEDFDPKAFAIKAQEIYVQAHEALMAKDNDRLRALVTDRAYPEMRHNAHCTTIRWKFLQSLEPPRVVHARQTHVIEPENMFGQITVRMLTQQTLAIYDRFGRLMHGSEIIAKDVLEYVVFECNISNEYGTWRLHTKIVPDWAEPKQPSFTTWRVAEEPPRESQDEAVESVQIESAAARNQEATVENAQIDAASKNPPPPPVAVA